MSGEAQGTLVGAENCPLSGTIATKKQQRRGRGWPDAGDVDGHSPSSEAPAAGDLRRESGKEEGEERRPRVQTAEPAGRRVSRRGLGAQLVSETAQLRPRSAAAPARAVARLLAGLTIEKVRCPRDAGRLTDPMADRPDQRSWTRPQQLLAVSM